MFENISIEIIMAVVASLTVFISTLVGIYTKKLSNTIKRNMLKSELSRYVEWVKDIDLFKNMSNEEQISSVAEQLVTFAQENEIVISESALMLMISDALADKQKFAMRMKTSLNRYAVMRGNEEE